MYRDADEIMPHDISIGRGKPVRIPAFVDASHVVNKKTRRSLTGFIVFLNRAPIARDNRPSSRMFGVP